MNKTTSVMLRLGAFMLCIAMLFSLSLYGCSKKEDGWQLVEENGSVITKKLTAPSEINHELVLNYDAVVDIKDLSPAEDTRGEIIGQWISSIASCDYSLHFSLFSEEILRNTIYSEFEKLGYTPEQANEKIAQTVSETVGFSSIRLELSISEIKTNDPQAREQLISKRGSLFEQAGLNVSEFEEVTVYYFDKAIAYYNNTFHMDLCHELELDDGIIIYKHEGSWYITPMLLDDDLSIDLIQAKKGADHGYYKEKYARGTIDAIENGYVRLGNEYFLLRDNGTKLAVGDEVKITYYSVGMDLERISDDKECDIGVIASIEASN